MPAVLLAGVVGCLLATLRFVPVAGEPVAAIFRPGLGVADAVGRLPDGWRLLGIPVTAPLPVLLLRPVSPAAAAPAGAWLLLRAAAVRLCLPPTNARS